MTPYKSTTIASKVPGDEGKASRADLLAALREIDAMPYYAAPLQDYAVDSLLKRYNHALDIARAALSRAKSA